MINTDQKLEQMLQEPKTLKELVELGLRYRTNLYNHVFFQMKNYIYVFNHPDGVDDAFYYSFRYFVGRDL